MIFTINKWRVSISFKANRPWTYSRIYKYEYGMRIVWYRLSVSIDDMELVHIPICKLCDSDEIGEVHAGDESWTMCRSCRAIEQGYKYISLKEYERRSNGQDR